MANERGDVPYTPPPPLDDVALGMQQGSLHLILKLCPSPLCSSAFLLLCSNDNFAGSILRPYPGGPVICHNLLHLSVLSCHSLFNRPLLSGVRIFCGVFPGEYLSLECATPAWESLLVQPVQYLELPHAPLQLDAKCKADEWGSEPFYSSPRDNSCPLRVGWPQ